MEVLNIVFNTIKNIRLLDILDILIIAYAIFKGYMLIKETRAEQLFKGIMFILFLLPVGFLLDLKMVSFILKNALTIGVLSIVIIFQPEIRKALEHLGRSAFYDRNNKSKSEELIAEISHSVASMSSKNIGALIVIERNTKLGDIVDSGTKLYAKVSRELIESIFFPNSPFHDGAIIIKDDIVEAAGCFLPLSNARIDKTLGTRHRAASGMSELSDAVIIVVSEETGIISVFINGKMTRNYDFEKLHIVLTKMFTYKKQEKVAFIKGRFENWARKRK